MAEVTVLSFATIGAKYSAKGFTSIYSKYNRPYGMCHKDVSWLGELGSGLSSLARSRLPQLVKLHPP